jgi:hypothetical protein
MPNQMIKKDAREGKGSTKQLEKKWDRAKDAAGKDKGEQNWALTNYIYQKMTSSADKNPLVTAAVTRVAAYFALRDIRASRIGASDLNTSQGDDAPDLDPGEGGAPDTYDTQDEENTPGVIDRPDPVEEVVHGDDTIYSSVSPDAMGQGSSPTEMQDATEWAPELFKEIEAEFLKSRVVRRIKTGATSGNGLPELPKGEQPQAPVDPIEPVEPVQPIEPKQAASQKTLSGTNVAKATANRILRKS